jgi:uncharacterized protein YgiM (DUF1202 family)
LYIVVTFGLIWLAPTLACGSFAPRPTPTPTTPAVGQPNTGGPEPAPATIAATPLPAATAVVDAPTPTPTFTATAVPGTALAVGQPARVTAPNGLNMREQASTTGTLVLQLGTGQRVAVLEGPLSNDGYTWWLVQDEQGNSGWVADGDGETVWLSPQIGAAQPVNRPPQVGDRVEVTMEPNQQLSLRALPGTDAPLITQVNPGMEFTVINGPQSANGYTWYQVRSDDGTLEGWVADGTADTRWLSPLE